MTELARQIVLEAYKDLQNPCKETPANSNRGPCVNAIQRSTGVLNDFWCASYAVHLIDRAVAVVNATNYLPRTASSVGMLAQARKEKKLRVDQTPAAGAVFYRKSGDSAASGHIGVVLYVESSGKIWTIEGNVSDRVASYYYLPSEITKKGFWFMHTEEMPVAGQAEPGDIYVAIAKVQTDSLRKGGKPANHSTTDIGRNGYLPGGGFSSSLTPDDDIDPAESNTIPAKNTNETMVAIAISSALGIVSGVGVASYALKKTKGGRKKDKTTPIVAGLLTAGITGIALNYAITDAMR